MYVCASHELFTSDARSNERRGSERAPLIVAAWMPVLDSAAPTREDIAGDHLEACLLNILYDWECMRERLSDQ